MLWQAGGSRETGETVENLPSLRQGSGRKEGMGQTGASCVNTPALTLRACCFVFRIPIKGIGIGVVCRIALRRGGIAVWAGEIRLGIYCRFVAANFSVTSFGFSVLLYIFTWSILAFCRSGRGRRFGRRMFLRDGSIYSALRFRRVGLAI